MKKTPSIFIIGGGLAGLSNAILLSRAGFPVTIIERKTYPFHKVCGEYVSNEVLPFLHELGLDPAEMGASEISRLVLTSPRGKMLESPLGLGGFGLSRYKLDYSLYQIALREGVDIVEGEKVNDVSFLDGVFGVQIGGQQYEADLVIGSYGKRSNLDQKMGRSFFYERSPYMAVKYFVKGDFAHDTIHLDNFDGGYCGFNKIEDDLFCLCYLTRNKHLKKFGSIPAMEEAVLMKNPALRRLFKQAEFVWDKPESINEIAFQRKSLVDQHILMCGDTAGMIAPLCGNGMAIAFHSAKILSGHIIRLCATGFSEQIRAQLEREYASSWQREFALRLKIGRGIQRSFGRPLLSELVVSAMRALPGAVPALIERTHGKPFV
ncbi:MAG: NAD(P)/FAD-dependent oxidoreductase [Arcticibacter sp.]